MDFEMKKREELSGEGYGGAFTLAERTGGFVRVGTRFIF